MLPYLQQQAIYALASLVVMLVVWRLLGRLAREPLRRMLCCLGGFALILLVYALVTGFDAGGSNLAGFRLIAFGYYGFGIVLPLVGLLQWRRSKAAALFSLPILAISLWAALGEPDRLQTRAETVRVERFATGRPIRIVHVSDLQTVGHCEREDEALRRIAAWKPDLIVFSGDYLAGPFEDPEPAMAAARRFLAGLHARLGVVVVDGHAEPRRLRERLFEGLDLIYLKDEGASFDLGDGRRLRVFGATVHDPDLDGLRPPADPGELSIVVSHMPDLSPELDGRGVDLHVAGHTHGGQICVPGFGAILTLSALPRRYARGLHRFGDHRLNVCAGLGMEGDHAPRIRLFCPPEICFIEVEGGAPPPGR
ncbi:MAG: metallophosphoesterase [Planctomycetes bacterium]|nr:metallophosphoesterase [Planctomycetota bacterium]